MAIPQKQIIRISKRFLQRPSFYVVITLIIGLAVQWQSHYYHARVSSGVVVRVVDGDTIVLNDLKIRLQGIDVPESKQTCKRKTDEEIWQCGLAATEKLITLIGNNAVECTNEGNDKYQRQLAYCYVDDLNLNVEMVKQGYAVSYVQYDMLFLLDEWYARWYSRGIWASHFINPSDWRHQNKRRS
jgi:endonuclease YncB( thermonuclease family)